MFKKIAIISLGLLCLNNSILAQDSNSFYVQASTGASFSMKAKFGTLDPTWDLATEGYDARLGNVPLFGIGLGYNINPWLSTLVSADWRGVYKYKQYQTTTEQRGPLLLRNKNRYFDIKNTNLMLSIIANSSGLSHMHIDFNNGSMLAPFIGAGLGVAQNDLNNFHTEATDNPGVARSYMDPKTSYSLAAQAMTGLSYLINKNFGVDLGYRFYYGGKFKTNDYIISSQTRTAPWEAKLLANEVFVNLKYNF